MFRKDPFDDIRPYYDEEVVRVCQELIEHPTLISIFDQLGIPILPEFYTVDSTESMQMLVMTRVGAQVLKKYSAGLTLSGLEHLDQDDRQGFLFVSNHRDIVLDPGLMIYAVCTRRYTPIQIAVGSNLLTSPFVTSLMRANRSFIVERGLPRRKQLKASKRLSDYIWEQIHQGDSIWIAQREGRAKDGNDFTNPALVSMFQLSKRKELPLSEIISNLNILPVAISYEWDPCDELKAGELAATSMGNGSYKKTLDEDIRSISLGITGFKGRIHLAFGRRLEGSFQTVKEVAEEIDRQIISCYKLWPSNQVADELAYNTPVEVSPEDREVFLERLNRIPESLRRYFLEMYANPAKNKRRYTR